MLLYSEGARKKPQALSGAPRALVICPEAQNSVRERNCNWGVFKH